MYYNKLGTENPTESDLAEIRAEQYRLIEAIANSLGYKDKITWETIQNPYIPKGLADSMMQQQQYQNNQMAILEQRKDTFFKNEEGQSEWIKYGIGKKNVDR